MADAKISALTAVVTPATTDEFAVNQGSTSKKITLKQIKDYTGGVRYDATGSAIGPTIADYFTATLSLEASSTYWIDASAYFLKTTAGTVTFTWLCSSAPIFLQSQFLGTAAAGFTTSAVTTAPVTGQVVAEALATVPHAATASLTTAVRHAYAFDLKVRTNAATTLQLRVTSGAGTVTPQAGSYMRANKIG